MTCYIKTYKFYRLNLNFKKTRFSSKKQRRDIIASYNDGNNIGEDEDEDFSVITIINEYIQFIEKGNFGQINDFLKYFSKQLDQNAFRALEKSEEDCFSYFTEIFLQQLSYQTDESEALQYLQIFYQIQTLFRFFSYLTYNQPSFKILFHFFDFENLKIINQLILIFTQYLPVNYHIFDILKDKFHLLLQLVDSSITQSLLNFINTYLSELTEKHCLSIEELLFIEQLLMSILDENIDSNILNSVSFSLKNMIFCSLEAFLTLFDIKTVNFFEQLLIKSASEQDYYSQMASENVLESILLLTSKRIPTLFTSQVNLLCKNFDLSILIEFIENRQVALAITSIQCICNFALCGSIDRVLSSNDIIECLVNKLEVGDFDIKQEIILCFTCLISNSTVDYTANFLTDENLLSLFCELLPTLNIKYVVNFLKSLLNAIFQCSKTDSFEDIKNTFANIDFLQVFELIDVEVDDDLFPEIQEINDSFQEILTQ